MTRTYHLTAVITREGERFVAVCPELDIASHGDTVEEARSNLVEALEGFFEVASDQEIADSLPVDVSPLEVAVG